MLPLSADFLKIGGIKNNKTALWERGEGAWKQAKWQECLQLAEITWNFSPR